MRVREIAMLVVVLLLFLPLFGGLDLLSQLVSR